MEQLNKTKITEIAKVKSSSSFPIIGEFRQQILTIFIAELTNIYFLANFQSGIPTNADEIIAKRVQNAEDGSKFSLIATPNSLYKADITDAGNEFVNTFLAIRNRRTNSIQLLPFKSASYKHSAFDDTSSIYERNIVDVKKVIAKEFGGKKALAGYEKSKKNQPNVEVLEEVLELQLSKLDDDKIFDKDVVDSSASLKIFPDLDLSGGKSVREIFKVSKLIGEDTIAILSETAIELLSSDQKNIKLANNYLTQSVKSIQMSSQPDKQENLEKVALLLYIDALVRLQNNRKRKWDQIVLSPFSPGLGKIIEKKFATEGSIANSKSTKQKSLVFYLILMLMSTENLEIEISHVLEGITDLTKTEVLKYAQVLGAKVKDGSILYIHKVNLDKNSQFSIPIRSGNRKRKA